MNQKIVAIIAIIVIACIAIAAILVFVKSPEPATTDSLNNTQKALAVLASLQTGDKTAIGNYISADTYIQHNLAFPDGRDALLNSLDSLKQAGTTVKPIRYFGDGDYVVVHSEYFLFGKNQVGFDIFRFSNGKIVEHWDNLQEEANTSKSGHNMTDGPTHVTDLDKTGANKALVSDFAVSVLQGKNLSKFQSFFDGNSYTQHNPLVPDGVLGLSTALQEFAAQGEALQYNQTHLVLGEGNFVLAASEGSLGSQQVTYYDLFRVENGSIAEHWDVIEPLMLKDQWKNQNGKF